MFTRITNPHLNSFLLAPLATGAGGSGACGTTVFASTEDEDYQRILETFEPLDRMLEQIPRMDMANASCPQHGVPLGCSQCSGACLKREQY
ncbi:MAG: hypothetical protein ACYSUY_15170 [Planctomycetota bacterium]